MPHEVKFDKLPAGYSDRAVRAGEPCSLIAREFTSSEDGELFISKLEGIPSQLIGMVPAGHRVPYSMVDNLLAVIRRDRTAFIWLNDVPTRLAIRAKRAIEAGQPVGEDDIADVDRIDFQGIEIPDDAGVLWIFSQRWRKGLYFDLEPLHGPVPVRRSYDLGEHLARHYAYLSFQHIFKLSEDDWAKLFSCQWFPFISLKQATIRDLISHARHDFDLNALTDRIDREIVAELSTKLDTWKRNVFFSDHLPILQQAVERHVAGDYISSISILFPRIEGLMRTYHLATKSLSQMGQSELAATVTEGIARPADSLSLFLPARFRRFLTEVYFAHFDPAAPSDLSRNTVSHGVAPVSQFDKKGSLLGLLIVDQLFFFMRSQKPESPADGS
jgi:hypothetical protein